MKNMIDESMLYIFPLVDEIGTLCDYQICRSLYSPLCWSQTFISMNDVMKIGSNFTMKQKKQRNWSRIDSNYSNFNRRRPCPIFLKSSSTSSSQTRRESWVFSVQYDISLVILNIITLYSFVFWYLLFLLYVQDLDLFLIVTSFNWVWQIIYHRRSNIFNSEWA